MVGLKLPEVQHHTLRLFHNKRTLTWTKPSQVLTLQQEIQIFDSNLFSLFLKKIGFFICNLFTFSLISQTMLYFSICSLTLLSPIPSFPSSSYSLIIQPHPLYYSISNSYSVKPVLSSQITVLRNRDLFPFNLTRDT